MIRLAQVVYEPAHSGQAAHVLSLVQRLDQARYSLCVCYPAGDDITRRTLAKWGVPGVGWPMGRWRNAAPARALFGLVRECHISLVHVHGQFAGLWARPAARLAGASVIYTPQTIRIRQERLARAYRLTERGLGHLTDRLISVCEADRSRLIEERWLPARRIVTIPNGIDWDWWHARRQRSDAARRALGWPTDCPITVQVGRLDEQKAPELFVAVASLIAQRVPSARFYMAGDGPLKGSLEARIRCAGLNETVTLLGQRSDVPTLMAAADVVTLTSRWEGLPYSLLEAGALGRPAVCTDVNGSSEVVLNGETGYVVPPDDGPAFADAVLRLIGAPSQACQMGEAAGRRVQRYFSLDNMVNATTGLYEDVLLERRQENLG